MEKAALTRLMDFGRFLGNSRLAALAAEAESRCPAAGVLKDDDLEELFAAGDPSAWRHEEEDDHDH